MLRQLLGGTLLLVVGLGFAGGILVGLRSRMVYVMPMPIRVLFWAAGLLLGGVVLAVFVWLAVIAYTGSGPIGDPCPPYC